MKKVLTVSDTIQAGYWRARLEERGIQCMVKNDYLGGGIGELPVNECWPELWVLDPRDEQLAKSIINETRDSPAGENWRCSVCQEILEPQFTQCWQCGAGRE